MFGLLLVTPQLDGAKKVANKAAMGLVNAIGQSTLRNPSCADIQVTFIVSPNSRFKYSELRQCGLRHQRLPSILERRQVPAAFAEQTDRQRRER